jgi:hypothetical protein
VDETMFDALLNDDDFMVAAQDANDDQSALL